MIMCAISGAHNSFLVLCTVHLSCCSRHKVASKTYNPVTFILEVDFLCVQGKEVI